MKHDADELLERAMKLPAEARAALAGFLIESLDETVDEGAEEAWATEIAHRLEELRAGRVQLIPWSEARRRIAGRQMPRPIGFHPEALAQAVEAAAWYRERSAKAAAAFEAEIAHAMDRISGVKWTPKVGPVD